MIVIVSGVPRSGTAMMMQMLEAGGISPLTDGLRVADMDNPRGYYEYEPVKTLREDPSWLEAAEGKAVKVVFSLLYDLPPDRRYHIILMHRDMAEVVASQQAMLARTGTAGKELTAERLAELFEAQLARGREWLEQQPNLELLCVDYHEALADPRASVQRLDAFLGGGLDVDAMASVVDSDLYRQRLRNLSHALDR